MRTITRSKIADHHRRTQAQPVGLGGSNADERLRQAPANEDPADPAEADALHQFRLRGLELIRAEFGERTWRMFWRAVVDQVPIRGSSLQELRTTKAETSSAAAASNKWSTFQRSDFPSGG